ncbi:MAG: LEA type 2 family protein [bacterium]|nr:LEA type 2 family protein [bacterium]
MIKIFRNLLPVSWVVFNIFLLINCAGLGKQLEPPRISLAHIQPRRFTGLEAVFQIQLRVFNTNDVDLEVKGIEADLEINGQSFATGVAKTAVKIPAFDTALVPVTIYSSVLNIVKGIHGLQDAERLKYRLKGKLRVGGQNMMSTTLPFESEGQVTLDAPGSLGN